MRWLRVLSVTKRLRETYKCITTTHQPAFETMLMNQQNSKRKNRAVVFKIITAAVPFLFLFLLECGLRMFHYGADLSLFIESPLDKNYLFLNPDASKRYFLNQKNATTGNVEPFLKKKAAGTRRIFVLGESTTIGYPYFHNGSFHRWLQFRLSHTFPDQHFEVINLALTAVNSYTVLGFARELVNYAPDAVLIYTGHNEYYGAMGVGSAESIAGSPCLVNALLRLRGLKVMQLAARMYAVLVPAGGGHEGTRMQRMVADQQIGHQSEAYRKGVEQFRTNMDQTLAILHTHHIPVLLSNLVSNEKDLLPFASAPVDRAKFPGFERDYNEGLDNLANGDSSAAYRFFNMAYESNKVHAGCNYYLGQLAYARRQFTLAREYFAKARDLDGLRFRAPEEFNGIIGQLVARYPNARLVDTKGLFERNSPGGIIGKELILEHVHPDLTGYALMSEAFYQALKKHALLPAMAAGEMSFPQLLRTMPISRIDSLAGIYKVANLKNSWPFRGNMQSDSFRVERFEEQTAYALANRKLGWNEAMSEAYNHYMAKSDYPEARKIVESLILEQPYDQRYYMKSAMLSGQMHREDDALFSFRKAFELVPSYESARYLFVLYLKKDQPEKALPYLDYAIRNNASGSDLPRVRTLAGEVVSLKAGMRADSTNVGVLNRIASAYYQMDNRDGALHYARKILRLRANDPAALQLIALLGSKQ